MHETQTEYVKTRDRVQAARTLTYFSLPGGIFLGLALSASIGIIGFAIGLLAGVLATGFFWIRGNEVPRISVFMNVSEADFLQMLPESMKCENCGAALTHQSWHWFYDTCQKCGNDNTKPFKK